MAEAGRGRTTELVVENELLTNELRRLRSRVAELETQLEAHRVEVRRLLDDAAANANPGDLERHALSDIRYLLDKVERTPAARLLRRRSGYRALLDRYRAD